MAIVLGWLIASAPARAEDTAATAAAREHYQKGTAFFDLGKYQDAIKEFEAAYEAKNDPAFLYNLAQSYRLAGNPEQALRFYRTYLRKNPKPPNRADIEEKIAQLEKLVDQKTATQTSPPTHTIQPALPGSSNPGGPSVPTAPPVTTPAPAPTPPPLASTAPPAAPPPET
ncbi:MAG TPA: tetratricopeptide repeat protein, partial [Polyangia bacterium]|nr:tetratricopeptide repeat protein [Polyangia bacterium]